MDDTIQKVFFVEKLGLCLANGLPFMLLAPRSMCNRGPSKMANNLETVIWNRFLLNKLKYAIMLSGLFEVTQLPGKVVSNG